MAPAKTRDPAGTAKPWVSICIPTYNRAAHLANCLESILVSRAASGHVIQVCVSDNGSTDDTESVVRAMQQRMPVEYLRNTQNVGMSGNFLKAVEMADAEFTWLLGDDDLVVPDGVERICRLLEQHSRCDFFYLNSFHLTTEYVFAYPQPFSTENLPTQMEPFSAWTSEGELPFFDLVDPRISFDFLGGIFLTLFRTSAWRGATDTLNTAALAEGKTFSAFDNTFPHLKVFARAFASSTAYFNARPVSVCLTGAREWAPMYPMVRSVRLVEALHEYRNNGLALWRFVWCKNFALRTFLPDLAYMIVHRSRSGLRYVNPFALIFRNCLYPNFYLSAVYYAVRKLKGVVRSLLAPTGTSSLQPRT